MALSWIKAMWFTAGKDAIVIHAFATHYVENQIITDAGFDFESRDTSGNTTLLVKE